MSQAEIGIVGGSGLYSMPGLTDLREVRQETPFGDPSDVYVLGTLAGRKVAFLARHGRGHRILPTELNFRANVYGFKQLGVERIVSVSAVGSLKEGSKVGVTGKRGGTYLNMEGPQFSTKAESNLYRSWGMDVIGMTNLQEAKLAREAEICYVTVAMVTDYDCWHPHHHSVTVDQIVAVLVKNAENAARVVRETVAGLPAARECKCGSALAHAILTERDQIPAATRQKLSLILDKYLSREK